jgi:Family of unknown function (DUF6221)
MAAMSDADAVAWLREQVTDRLEKARSATAGPWVVNAQTLSGFRVTAPDGSFIAASVRMWSDGSPDAAQIALNDPPDTIDRCEAELAILDEHPPHPGTDPPRCETCLDSRLLSPEYWEANPWPCKTVRLVASAYRHRLGYAEHWGREDR